MQTQCVAHRGNSVAALENSIAALSSAMDVGAPIVEFDVHHTRDGQPLIMHDGFLGRTTRGADGTFCPIGMPISQLTLAQIRGSCVLRNGEEIPTLGDVLTLLQRSKTAAFVEFKDLPTAQTLDLLVESFRDHPDRLFIIAFSAAHLTRARDYLTGKFRNSSSQPHYLHLATWESEADFRFDGVSVWRPSAAFVQHAKEQGRSVSVWTIDTDTDMHLYRGWGVDFITTNNPGLCLDIARR